MKQMSFADADTPENVRQTRRERFLIEMDTGCPLEAIAGIKIEPHYPRVKVGALPIRWKPHAAGFILMQNWFGTAIRAMEEAPV